MDKEERDAVIRYGTHAFASKEAKFIRVGLADKVQAGHVPVIPLEAVTALQKLCLLPVAFIPQEVRIPRLIFDFTWIGLNDIAESVSPMEAMRFRGAILRILKQVLAADSHLGPVYLSKVDLADAYMMLWVRM